MDQKVKQIQAWLHLKVRQECHCLERNIMQENKQDKYEFISENIKEQMQAQMAADSSVTYFYNSDTPEWDFKELRGDESFYFNEKGELVITFDETDVAPTYMGAVEFAIPQSVTGTLE